MKFASVNQAARFLEKAKKKQGQIEVLRNGRPQQVSIYNTNVHEYSNGGSTVAEITSYMQKGEKNIGVNALGSISICRGYSMENIIKHKEKFTPGSKVDTPNNITCVLITTRRKELIDSCLQLIHNVEYQAGWSLSKIVHLRSNAYALLSSKRWSACLPLYSALVLFFKVGTTPLYINGYNKSIWDFETPEQFLEAVSKHTAQSTIYQGTRVNLWDALLECLENGLLVKLMRHYRYIAGKNPYQHLEQCEFRSDVTYGYVHSTGIGDFLKLLKYGNKPGSKSYLHRESRYSTVFVHGAMVERARKKLLSI